MTDTSKEAVERERRWLAYFTGKRFEGRSPAIQQLRLWEQMFAQLLTERDAWATSSANAHEEVYRLQAQLTAANEKLQYETTRANNLCRTGSSVIGGAEQVIADLQAKLTAEKERADVALREQSENINFIQHQREMISERDAALTAANEKLASAREALAVVKRGSFATVRDVMAYADMMLLEIEATHPTTPASHEVRS